MLRAIGVAGHTLTASGSCCRGREHQRSAHHSERTGPNRRSSSGMGVSLEEEDDFRKVRQYGSGGHSEFRLLAQPSGNEPNEMPNVHGGFPRVPDQGHAHSRGT